MLAQNQASHTIALTKEQKESALPITDSVHNHAYLFGSTAIAVKLAMCDGAVNQKETSRFLEIFGVRRQDERKMMLLFSEAKEDPTAAEVFAKQLAFLFKDKPYMLQMLAEKLVSYALCDGLMNQKEADFLKPIIEIFGIDDGFLVITLRKLLVPTSKDPYELLQVPRNIPKSKLREFYMARVKRCHPDYLESQKASPIVAEMLTSHFRELTDAYHMIRKQKRFF